MSSISSSRTDDGCCALDTRDTCSPEMTASFPAADTVTACGRDSSESLQLSVQFTVDVTTRSLARTTRLGGGFQAALGLSHMSGKKFENVALAILRCAVRSAPLPLPHSRPKSSPICNEPDEPWGALTLVRYMARPRRARNINETQGKSMKTNRYLSIFAGILLPTLSSASHAEEAFLPRAINSSTIPQNGDVNPYGVAFVPGGFPTGGAISAGDVLISNF